MAISQDRLSFEKDIRPLFRAIDRDRMEWAFDLWRYEDVRENADLIFERLEAGEMPCDGAWPEENVARFRTWREAGMMP